MANALVVGRFQPIHKGHLEAIHHIVKKHGHLLILVGSSQYRRTLQNPFSLRERKEMLRACLEEEGLLGLVEIIEMKDVHDNEKWTQLVLRKAKGVRVAYTNNPLVKRLLKPFLQVKKMTSGVKISSTQIRNMMRKGNKRWKKFVPLAVQKYLETKRLTGIVQKLA